MKRSLMKPEALQLLEIRIVIDAPSRSPLLTHPWWCAAGSCVLTRRGCKHRRRELVVHIEQKEPKQVYDLNGSPKVLSAARESSSWM